MSTLKILFLSLLLLLPAGALETLEGDDSGQVTLSAATPETVIGAGARVRLLAPIARNAVVAGSDVTITSSVGGDVIAAGRAVRIEGEVSGDVIAAGETVTIAPSAHVAGDVMACAAAVEVNGTVDGQVHLSGGELAVHGTVGEGVNVSGGRLDLAGAAIAGDVAGTLQEPFTPQATAQLGGRLDLTAAPAPGSDWKSLLMGSAFCIGTTIILGLVTLVPIPGFAERLRVQVSTHPAQSFLVGLIALLLSLPVLILLFGLIVTAPLALLLMFILGVAGVVGIVAGHLWVGDALTQRRWRPIGSLCLGAVVLGVLGLVPVLGAILATIVLVAGGGAVLCLFWHWVQRARQRSVERL